MVDIAMNSAEHCDSALKRGGRTLSDRLIPRSRKTMLEIAVLYNQLAALAQKRTSSKSD
jgi:hypothetical protein